VSLTVNRVTDSAAGCEISINLIPHTLEVTARSAQRVGDRVNLEADLIARYVERVLNLSVHCVGRARLKTA
jgi:riboflavin synthase